MSEVVYTAQYVNVCTVYIDGMHDVQYLYLLFKFLCIVWSMYLCTLSFYVAWVYQFKDTTLTDYTEVCQINFD